MPRQVSFAVESFGYVWDQTANGGLGDWVKATQAGGGGSAGGLTNAELRASPVPVQATLDPMGLATDTGQATGNASLASIDTKLTGPVAVSLASVPSHPVTGPLTDTQLRASAVPVSLASVPTHGVTGTFWQGTQPVSGPLTDAQLRAVAVPVSGTVTASGPLTDAQLRASAVPVSGVFFQATQPVSATSWPLPTGSATEATLAAMNTKFPASVGQKAMVASLPVVLASDQTAVPTTKVPTGGTNVLKTGTLSTVAVTADQVVLTYTVTAAKTFYLCYLLMYGRLTVLSATATILGAITLESPAGTKLITLDDVNPTTGELEFNPIVFSEPIPIAAGVVIRVVVTPAAATSMLWRANFGGFEK